MMLVENACRLRGPGWPGPSQPGATVLRETAGAWRCSDRGGDTHELHGAEKRVYAAAFDQLARCGPFGGLWLATALPADQPDRTVRLISGSRRCPGPTACRQSST